MSSLTLELWVDNYPDEVIQRSIEVRPGTTARELWCDWCAEHRGTLHLDENAPLGVWGIRLDGTQLPKAEDYRVSAGDRIEVYQVRRLAPEDGRKLRLNESG